MWATNPFMFVGLVFFSSCVGSVAAELKDVNGECIRWRRLICRSIYRAVNGTAFGLAISPITNDLRLLFAAILAASLIGIGERQILALLPFNKVVDDESQEGKKIGDGD